MFLLLVLLAIVAQASTAAATMAMRGGLDRCEWSQ
jgi:hypothetical protein